MAKPEPAGGGMRYIRQRRRLVYFRVDFRRRMQSQRIKTKVKNFSISIISATLFHFSYSYLNE
jgi:hypothetical protein